MKCNKHFRTISLIIGLSLLTSVFNHVKSQRNSENDQELRRYLMYYPLADLNGDGILTDHEYRRYRKMLSYIDSRQKYLTEMPERTLINHPYGPHWRNTFDFWKADTDQPAPLLIFFHGGGFLGGDKSRYYGDSLAIACLQNGISVITANYRYTIHSRFPGPYLDAARLIQFVRYHSKELGIDPERIATTGSSAGGNLSIWLAVKDDLADPLNPDPVLRESSRLTTVIPKNAQTSNDPFFWTDHIYDGGGVHNVTWDFFGLDEMDKDEVLEQVSDEEYRKIANESSAINFISKDDPPVFFVYPERVDEWDGKPLPEGTPQSVYGHHVAWGVLFKQKYDEMGLKSRIKAHRDVTVQEELDWLKKYFRRD
jgi:acetyl esterase